ncbi:hypothetical protein FOA52_005179 [Chlamydomonas sp. UWO 241]|nr:hypothetical protein FOA52_005179 [Chlamydomonas sp. UWO 241]
MTSVERALQSIPINDSGTGFGGFAIPVQPMMDQAAKRRGGHDGRGSDVEEATHSKRVKLEGGENAAPSAAAAGASRDSEHASRQPPPSDFGNFNASLRRKSGPGGGSDAPDDAPVPALLSFADISSRGGGAVCGAQLAARPTLLDSLKNIKGVQGLSRAHSNGAPSAYTAAPAPGPDAVRELPAAVMPYDWVLKRCVRVYSGRLHADAEAMLRLHPRDAAAAHDAFLSGVDVSSASGGARGAPGLQRSARLLASLLSWRFPDERWDPDAVRALIAAMPAAAGAGGAGGAGTGAPSGAAVLAGGGPAAGGGDGALRGGVGAVLGQRLASWRSALRSVYVSTRSGACPAFYMMVHGPKPYTILVCARGTRGVAGGPHALVSQSSGGIRAKLSAAGVAFTLPLAPAHGDEARRAVAVKLRRVDDVDDLDAIAAAAGDHGAGEGGTPRWTSARDHTPESMLLFVGATAVHGLIDVLMNKVHFQEQTFLGREPADLPTLLAPVAFEGAIPAPPLLRALPPPAASAGAHGGAGLQRQGSVGGARAAGGEDGGGGSIGGACVELSGPVPPWTLHRLLTLMQAQGEGGGVAGAAGGAREAGGGVATVQLDADASCLGLNLVVAGALQQQQQQGRKGGGGADGGGGAPPRAGCVSGAEAGEVGRHPPELHKRHVKGVEVPAPGASPLEDLLPQHLESSRSSTELYTPSFLLSPRVARTRPYVLTGTGTWYGTAVRYHRARWEATGRMLADERAHRKQEESVNANFMKAVKGGWS